MRKILIALALLISTSLFAEKKVGEYTAGGKTWDIEADYTKKQELYILIQVKGEYKSDKVFYSITGYSDINQYKNSLMELRAKYEEWREVAVKNNVKDFKKYFDISWPSVSIFWLGSKWFLSQSTKALKPLFMVTEVEGDSGAVAFFGEAKSWSNEYITQKWYQIFSDPEEVQSLIDALDIEKIMKQIAETVDTEDLFK